VIKLRKASFRRTKDKHHELFMPPKLRLPQRKLDVCLYVFLFTTAEHAFWHQFWITSSGSIKFVCSLSDATTTHKEKSAIPRVLRRWSTIGDDFIVSLPTLHPETPMLNPNKAGEHTNREAFSLGRGFRPTDRKLIVLLRN
jgi:hypothetical protein